MFPSDELIVASLVFPMCESRTLEFKATWHSVDLALPTICAFINTPDGGNMVFGVSDSGTIVGNKGRFSRKAKDDILLHIDRIFGQRMILKVENGVNSRVHPSAVSARFLALNNGLELLIINVSGSPVFDKNNYAFINGAEASILVRVNASNHNYAFVDQVYTKGQMEGVAADYAKKIQSLQQSHSASLRTNKNTYQRLVKELSDKHIAMWADATKMSEAYQKMLFDRIIAEKKVVESNMVKRGIIEYMWEIMTQNDDM